MLSVVNLPADGIFEQYLGSCSSRVSGGDVVHTVPGGGPGTAGYWMAMTVEETVSEGCDADVAAKNDLSVTCQ